jgi:hypothetical protein
VIRLIHRDIINSPAIHTGDVIMVVGVAVETHLGISGIDLSNETRLGQHVQVSIDGPHTDAGDPPAHPLIHFIGCGMGMDLLDFLQNDLSLVGHSVFLVRYQEILLLPLPDGGPKSLL